MDPATLRSPQASTAVNRLGVGLSRTILLVEDDIELRAALRRFLEVTQPHFHVLVAGSAGEALEVLHATNVDSVVSDLRLPGRTGLELLKDAAKAAPRAHRVLITGYPSAPEFARAVNEGHIDGFLLKPFQPEALVRLLRRVTGEPRQPGLGRIPPNP